MPSCPHRGPVDGFTVCEVSNPCYERLPGVGVIEGPDGEQLTTLTRDPLEALVQSLRHAPSPRTRAMVHRLMHAKMEAEGAKATMLIPTPGGA